MYSQIEIGNNVCTDCPLAQAVNEAWTDYELFTTSIDINGVEFSDLDESEYDKVDITKRMVEEVIPIYKNQLVRYNEVLKSLTEYLVGSECLGKQEGSWTGTFCGVEGKLREMGVNVPEYTLRGQK